MIQRDHTHNLRPFKVIDRPDGLRDVFSRCVCGPGAQPGVQTTLEQRMTVDSEGRPRMISYRFGGTWFDALDLVRLGNIGVEECPACHGDPWPIEGLVCDRCGGVGVAAADGQPLRAPELTVV